MMRSVARLVLAIVVIASTLGLPTAWAHGDSPPPRPAPASDQVALGKVNIEVMVVHGSNQYDRVDATLQPVLQHLRFLNYRGFKLLDKQHRELGIGDKATFEIVGDREVQVELLSRDAQQAKIKIQMFNKRGKLLDTTVSIRRNKSFMVAGPRHEDGVLVLPLTARY